MHFACSVHLTDYLENNFPNKILISENRISIRSHVFVDETTATKRERGYCREKRWEVEETQRSSVSRRNYSDIRNFLTRQLS